MQEEDILLGGAIVLGTIFILGVIAGFVDGVITFLTEGLGIPAEFLTGLGPLLFWGIVLGLVLMILKVLFGSSTQTQ